MREISLSVVRSPLQLFNCIEANKRFADNESKILLLLFRKDFDYHLMNQILNDNAGFFEEIIKCDIRSNFKQAFLVLLLLIKSYKINTCFVGDTTHIINIALNTLDVKKFIKVDDGASTFFAAKWIVTKSYKVLNRHQKPIPRFLQITDAILRLGPNFFDKISFFTIYEGIREYTGDREVIHNDYRFFRQLIAELPVRNEVFFIGSDIRRYILNDPDDFEKYIAAVAAYYTGKKITYIMHRKENENEEQKRYVKYLSDKYGMNFIVFDRIIEQQILHQGWIPAEVATFFSSALDTLVAIYSPKATVFRLLPDDVRETSRFALGEMHRHYASMNVNIVSI